MLLKNCFAHSSVMIRSETLNHHGLTYDTSWATAQDYRLWCQLLPHGSCKNISTPLVRIRQHKQSVSNCRSAQQKIDEGRARQSYVRTFIDQNTVNVLHHNLIKNFLRICPKCLIERDDLLAQCKQHVALLRIIQMQTPNTTHDTFAALALTMACKAITKRPSTIIDLYRAIRPLLSLRTLTSLSKNTLGKFAWSLRVGGLKAVYLSFFPERRE
jgi:hypothetical protein